MSQYYVVNESSEDTLECTDDLHHAVNVAQEVARLGQPGDPITILDGGGKAVRQFVLMPDATVLEQPIAVRVRS